MKKIKFTGGDVFGGVTAGIVALPLALAFGVQSGMGAAAGLYGAIILGLFASVLGGTPSQISGPTGPMTVITTTTVAGFVAVTGGFELAIGALVACFVLAGIIQIIMGLTKVGSFIKYIPYPVISGFMSGIGVIIILLQLFPAIGQASPKSTVDVVKEIGPALSSINYYALMYSALTIAIIYLFPKITSKIPSSLVALLLVTGLSILLSHDVPTIGTIPTGLPEFKLSEIFNIPTELYTTIFEAALTLAGLGAIDSLLTSVVADNVTKTKHNSNRELIGQGIGNSLAGAFGGIPGAGATMRTLVNIRSGGRNRISGVIHAVVLLGVLLGLGKYAALIPKSVLAGILITVGIGILDYKGFKHLVKVPRPDAIIMIIVLLVTVFLDLLVAVAIGMVMASLLFMKKMGDMVEEETQTTKVNDHLFTNGINEDELPESLKDNVVVTHIYGPLFFGFAASFQEMIRNLSDLHYVIIRMDKVSFIDQTGLYALEDAVLSLEQKGVAVLLTEIKDQPKHMMQRIKLINGLIKEDEVFDTFDESISWLMKKHRV